MRPDIAAQIRYTPGETYYRHKETGVVYGKGMVQTNWKPPELEEMIAVEGGKTLVPVTNSRSTVAGQVPGRDHFKPRTPPRAVPRFDAPKRDLEYKYSPQDPRTVGHVRQPEAAELAAAAAAAQAHADERAVNTKAALEDIQKREQADLNARAAHAQQVAAQAQQAQQQPTNPLLAPETAPAPMAPPADPSNVAQSVGQPPVIAPFDLSSLTTPTDA